MHALACWFSTFATERKPDDTDTRKNNPLKVLKCGKTTEEKKKVPKNRGTGPALFSCVLCKGACERETKGQREGRERNKRGREGKSLAPLHRSNTSTQATPRVSVEKQQVIQSAPPSLSVCSVLCASLSRWQSRFNRYPR